MYSRSFSTNEKRREGSVPVEYFSDSFSADAFKETQANNKPSQHNKNDGEKTEKADHEMNKIAPNSSVRNYNFEDLILLGILLLFLSDAKDKEDLLIPVILAAVLLF